MSQLSRVLVIAGIGNSPHVVEALRSLSNVAAVIVVESPEPKRIASVGDPPPMALTVSMLREQYPVEPRLFKRERDHPTLREGIRRKTIKSLCKGRR